MSPADKLAAAKRAYKKNPKGERPGKPILRCLVKQRRTELDLSLQDIGTAVALSKMQIKSIEDGRSYAVKSMLALAKFFGCSVVDLWPELGEVQK